MNHCVIEVEQIRSYQVLVFKNGYRSFAKPEYKRYKKELDFGIRSLKPVKGNLPIKLKLTFNVKDAVDKEKFVVKMIKTGNTSKLCDTEQEALDYHDSDKHYIEHRPPVIKFGSIGDVDNVAKPVIDYMEEVGVLENDRYVTELVVKKTFNNPVETIQIEIEELEIINGINVSFKGEN